ncbi:hypothetical protein Hypma_007878 [Hypsizygus marmoreus]|uniref:Uncharacterized protein n=1 Tax=Hypsizygus marmoreus TaxID=39966 RepID=A0A369JZA0_HYPMA|nr:hypothetical protein Hypma_007878 [Hypsizygus marmoreus]
MHVPVQLAMVNDPPRPFYGVLEPGGTARFRFHLDLAPRVDREEDETATPSYDRRIIFVYHYVRTSRLLKHPAQESSADRATGPRLDILAPLCWKLKESAR